MDPITSLSANALVYLFQFVLSVSFLVFTIHRKALTASGAVSAVFLGNGVIYCSGFTALIPLLLFFGGSILISHPGLGEKAASDPRSELPRNAWQVMSNGGIYLLCCVLSYLSGDIHYQTAMLISIAVSTADTWSSEVGSRVKGSTYLFPSFQPTTPGISGGISLAGTLAGMTGAALIGASSWFFRTDISIVVTVTIAGICGMLVDSVLGNYLQVKYREAGSNQWRDYATVYRDIKGWRFVNNDIVNIASNIFITGSYLLGAFC